MSTDDELHQKQVPTRLPAHNFGSHKHLLFLPTQLPPSRLSAFCEPLPALGAAGDSADLHYWNRGTQGTDPTVELGSLDARCPSPSQRSMPL